MNPNYEIVIKIRAFEEYILDLFGKNKLSGTTHTYIGEEATAVAIMNYVCEDDVVFSNHRCHGHYLAYGGPAERLLAEIMSKESGLCQGRGGSQHIHYKNFFTNGIQGGIVPNALGVALGNKLSGRDGKAIVFLGDGTLGQGVVYESLNIASIYRAPIVFVVEDNQYAMSTKRTDAIAGDIKGRIEQFGISAFEIESTDVDELDSFFQKVFEESDRNGEPVCAIVHNYRLGAHSKGDDTRDLAEIAHYRQNDPVNLIISKIGEASYRSIYDGFRREFELLEEKLEQEPFISIEEPTLPTLSFEESFLSSSNRRYVEQIREALEQRLESDKTTILFGEDLREPYGGAFKVTKGLSEKYDKQVLNMPISEACIIGIAVGMGLSGMTPVAEMMFGDFISLGFDQLLNHAAKYGWIYGGGVSVPMVVRAPMGAKRGYGPTHSQSLEKFLIGIPLIKVLALSVAVNPKVFYRNIFATLNEPVVVIENKRLYGQKSWNISNGQYEEFAVQEIKKSGFPTFVFSMDFESEPDFVAITYGGMTEDVVSASEELMIQDEIQLDVVVLTQLSPLPLVDLREIIRPNAAVVVVEEGTKTGGIGAEIIASLAEAGIGRKYHRIAAYDMPIPNGIVLEKQMIPDAERIVGEIRRFTNGK